MAQALSCLEAELILSQRFGTCRRVLALCGLLLCAACTEITPKLSIDGRSEAFPAGFSHRAFDQVLKQSVDSDGLVDYASLKKMPEILEHYYSAVVRYSPDSHPERFPTESERLAYWINGYNAAAIKIVLEYYPIPSVTAVKPPRALFFMPDKSGFFLFQRVCYGGIDTSLYGLENRVIRERFAEPRVHFVLNCASRGCPRLPREAFEGRDLDRQLERETRRFFSEARNFRVDVEAKRVYLSSILDWYREDFIDWLERRYPNRKADLLQFARLYLDQAGRRKLDRLPADYSIEFIDYDWRLNDQKPTDEPD